MTFQYKIFPDLRLKHGVEKTINDPVAITGNGNREIRRKVNKMERYSWNVPSRNLTQVQLQEVVEFSRTVNSSMDAFLYKDPTMPELVDVRLKPVFANGAFMFALYHSGLHPVMNLGETGQCEWDFAVDPTQFVIKRNGVEMQYNNSEFSIFQNYDPSLLGGSYASYPRTFTINSAGPVWSGSDVVTFTGPVYSTVRLDSQISYKISAMGRSSLSSADCAVVPTVSAIADIKLMEVFEYTEAAN